MPSWVSNLEQFSKLEIRHEICCQMSRNRFCCNIKSCRTRLLACQTDPVETTSIVSCYLYIRCPYKIQFRKPSKQSTIKICFWPYYYCFWGQVYSKLYILVQALCIHFPTYSFFWNWTCLESKAVLPLWMVQSDMNTCHIHVESKPTYDWWQI